MDDLNLAIARIKNLECPTGEVVNRVAGILEDYNVANSNEIIIDRDEYNDNMNGEAYNIIFPGSNSCKISFYAKAGLDDYVAKVTDVKIV